MVQRLLETQVRSLGWEALETLQACYKHGYEDRSPSGARVTQAVLYQSELTLTTYSHDPSLTSRIMASFSAPDGLWIDASRAPLAFVSQKEQPASTTQTNI